MELVGKVERHASRRRPARCRNLLCWFLLFRRTDKRRRYCFRYNRRHKRHTRRVFGNHCKNVEFVIVGSRSRRSSRNFDGRGSSSNFCLDRLGAFRAEGVKVCVVGVYENVAEDVDILQNATEVGGVRDGNRLAGKFKGGQADRRTVGEVGRVDEETLDIGEQGYALAAREFRNLFAQIFRRQVFIVLQQLDRCDLIVRKTRIALVCAQQAKHEFVGVRDFVDRAQAVEAAKGGVAQVFCVVHNRARVLQNPAVVVHVGRVQNKTVHREQEFLDGLAEVFNRLFFFSVRIVAAGARERDFRRGYRDAVIRVPPLAAKQEERGFVLDGARRRPPRAPEAQVHEGRLFGIVCKELVA